MKTFLLNFGWPWNKGLTSLCCSSSLAASPSLSASSALAGCSPPEPLHLSSWGLITFFQGESRLQLGGRGCFFFLFQKHDQTSSKPQSSPLWSFLAKLLHDFLSPSLCFTLSFSFSLRVDHKVIWLQVCCRVTTNGWSGFYLFAVSHQLTQTLERYCPDAAVQNSRKETGQANSVFYFLFWNIPFKKPYIKLCQHH